MSEISLEALHLAVKAVEDALDDYRYAAENQPRLLLSVRDGAIQRFEVAMDLTRQIVIRVLKYSDLDLCIVGDSALSFRTLGLMQEAFEDSDLPYKVDLVDWATTSESFRKIIERDRVLVQKVELSGAVPSKSEWNEKPLGDVVELKRGYDLPKDKRSPGKVPIISSSGITDYHAESMVQGPGVVTGRYGTIGEVFFVEGDYWPLNTTLYVRDFKGNDALFVSYLLRTLDFHAYSDKGAVPGVNRNHLHMARVRVPDRVTQEAIAKVLNSLDRKITLNRRINQTLEAMAQAIFKSWFVDFDPVKAKIAAKQEGRDPLRAAMSAISGKLDTELDALPCEQYEQLATTAALFPDEMEESELGEIPKGWEVVSLYDTADYLNGAAFRASDFSEATEALPIIKIAELKQGVNSGTKRTLKEIDQKYKIESGDVLYSWSGSPDTSLEVFRWFGDKGLLNQHIFKLSFTQLGQREYTYYLLKEIKPILVATATQKQTTGLGHITVADMKRIKVTRPKLTELINFTKQLIQIYATTANHEQQSITLAALRDTLIPKLLSGELSVENILPESEATA